MRASPARRRSLARPTGRPAADHGAGLAASLGHVLTSQPAILATHAAVGLLLLVAGVSVLTRAVLTRHALAIASLLITSPPTTTPGLPQ